MLDIKVSSLIQITDGINVSGFELKVDLKIVRNTSGHYQANFHISWSTLSANSVKPESFSWLPCGNAILRKYIRMIYEFCLAQKGYDLWITVVPESCSTAKLVEPKSLIRTKSLIQTTRFWSAFVELNSWIKFGRAEERGLNSAIVAKLPRVPTVRTSAWKSSRYDGRNGWRSGRLPR